MLLYHSLLGLTKIMIILFKRWQFKKHLNDGEKLFEILHHHSIAIWGKVFAWILLGFGLPVSLVIFAHSLEFSFSWWWAFGWVFLSLIWIFYHFIDWYFDVLLITNYSLLHVQWNGIFDKNISRIEYEDIKEVEIETSGILESILQFGTVRIHTTAGGVLEMLHIHDPKNVEEIIRQYKSDYQKFQRYVDSSQVEQFLNEMIRKHVWEYGSKHGFLPRR